MALQIETLNSGVSRERVVDYCRAINGIVRLKDGRSKATVACPRCEKVGAIWFKHLHGYHPEVISMIQGRCGQCDMVWHEEWNTTDLTTWQIIKWTDRTAAGFRKHWADCYVWGFNNADVHGGPNVCPCCGPTDGNNFAFGSVNYGEKEPFAMNNCTICWNEWREDLEVFVEADHQDHKILGMAYIGQVDEEDRDDE